MMGDMKEEFRPTSKPDLPVTFIDSFKPGVTPEDLYKKYPRALDGENSRDDNEGAPEDTDA